MSILPTFAEHAPFIWAAYGLSALTLSGVIAIVLIRARMAKERLERLEHQVEEAD